METTKNLESIHASAGQPSRTPGTDPQRLARLTGWLYLSISVFGMFSPLVFEMLVVQGNAEETLRNLRGAMGLFAGSLVSWLLIVAVDVVLSATLYLMLRPVSETLALVSAAFRLTYSAVLGAYVLHLFDAFRLLTGAAPATGLDTEVVQGLAMSALHSFGAGFLVALVFFGVHLVTLGVLLLRSGYVPRVIGALLLAAGVGYIVESLANFLLPGNVLLTSGFLLAPALLGEYGLTGWLLFKGIRLPRTPAA